MTGDILAAEKNRSGGWLQYAGKHVDHGRFACSVGADQAVNLVFCETCGEIADLLQAFEIH